MGEFNLLSDAMPHDHPHDHDHNHDHGHHHHHHEPKFKLQAVRVYVGDFAGAFEFYAKTLGLQLVDGTPAGPFAFFDTGNSQLALERIPPNHPAYQELVGRFAAVSFRVADLSAVYDDLVAKGVVFMAAPQKQAWGGGIAHFRDPAGNILSLVGKIKEG
jgi:catechol 2,3-dioxygenase-like lactoylglutathione lyase family enzyme